MKILLLFTISLTLSAGTIQLDTPIGDLGTSYSWGTVTAYGFDQTGNPATLIGIDQPFNFLAGDGNNDQGLGIDNTPVCGGAPPSSLVSLPGYICGALALDVQGGESIWFTPIDAIQFAAYYPALADDWTVWGAQTLGGPKVWLFTGSDEAPHAIPPGYAYIVATGSNVLVGSVSAAASSVPEPTSVELVLAGMLALWFLRRQVFGRRE